MAVVRRQDKFPLPQEFDQAPGLEDEYSLLRQQILSRLKDEGAETGTPSTVDLMTMERASYLYSFIRQREAASEDGTGFGDRHYRDMFQMLIGILDKLKAAATKSEERLSAEIREAVVLEVVDAVRSATSSLPPEFRRVVQEKLVELVSR